MEDEKNKGIKKLEILVVEDRQTHLADAKDFFSRVEGVNVSYATTFSEAEEYLGVHCAPHPYCEPKVDGVITDIYLPIGNRFKGRSGDEDPVGLLVAARCHMKKLPFVFCTAGYHHGAKYNWINMLQRTMGWPEMVDGSGDPYAEAEHKPWERAYKTLKEVIERHSK